MIDDPIQLPSTTKQDILKIKLREERKKEYNEYKALEENKFRNRFLSKKKTDESIYNDITTKTFSSEVASPLRSSKTHVPDSTNSTVPICNSQFIEFRNDIHSQLQTLKEKLDQVYTYPVVTNSAAKSPIRHNKNDVSNTISDKTTFDNSTFEKTRSDNSTIAQNEAAIINQINYIKEAENRLSQLENEYLLVKRSMSKEPQTSTFNHFHSPTKQNNSLQTQNQFFMNRSDDPSIKKRNQDNYRHELERQIAEKKERRSNNHSNEPDNFFDKFPSQRQKLQEISPLKSQKSVEGTKYETEADSDYFYYAQKDLLNETIHSSPSKTSSIAKDSPLTLSIRENKLDQSPHLSPAEKKIVYAQELKKQMEESKLRKEEQKRKEAEYDKKKEKEIAEFDPFNQSKSSRKDASLNTRGHSVADNIGDLKNNPNTSTKQKEATFARGGHGIFGSPLTDKQKDNLDKYKKELTEQIEERKRRAAEEKRIAVQKEKEEMEKVLRQQQSIKEEYEREQKEKQINVDRSIKVTPVQEKVVPEKAYPVKKAAILEKRKSTPQLLIGPPISIKADRSRKKAYRPDNIFSKLDNLKSQIETEKTDVEKIMKSRRNRVEVFDTRDYIGKLKSKKIHSSPDKRAEDVFNKATLSKPRPVHVRRASSTEIEQLEKEEINRMYIIQKANERNTTLEKKQQVFLAKQSEYLRQLKDQLHACQMRSYSPVRNNNAIGDLEITNMSEQLPMISESNFINLDDLNIDSYKNRNQMAQDTKSEISLDLDKLIQKNEGRLRTLKLKNTKKDEAEDIERSLYADWPDDDNLRLSQESLDFRDLEADDWMFS